MSYAACYQILGLRHGAAPAEVHRAYKRLVLRYHPDRTADDPQSRAIFCLVTEAYATLRKTFHLRRPSRVVGDCQRCRRMEQLFAGLDGRYYCADCLLPGRRRLLPLPKFQTVRCVGAISLQALAAYCVVVATSAGSWHLGAAGMAFVIAAFAALGYNVWTADVIDW